MELFSVVNTNGPAVPTVTVDENGNVKVKSLSPVGGGSDDV